MAKKSLLPLLFSLFVANLPILKATNFENVSPLLTDTCEAPPPDSFWILNAGAHYVTLAWNPIDSMATYTIVVQKEGSNANTWENVDTIPNVTGNSITVQNLLYGSKYKFELATNCGNGDPSVIKVYAGPPIGVILDLVLNGRTPVNPIPVLPPCTPILFQNYKWVGMKVETSQNLGSMLNYFEFRIANDGVPQIRRVNYGPNIVATDHGGFYPIFPSPNVIELLQSEFQFRRVDGTFPVIIGTIEVTYNPILKTVQFCKKAGAPWASGYSLSVMSANQVNGLSNNPVVDRTEQDSSDNCSLTEIKVLSPVYNGQLIFTGFAHEECDQKFEINIYDSFSRLVFTSQSIGVPMSLDLSRIILPSGIYYVSIQGKGQKTAHKVMKF